MSQEKKEIISSKRAANCLFECTVGKGDCEDIAKDIVENLHAQELEKWIAETLFYVVCKVRTRERKLLERHFGI